MREYYVLELVDKRGHTYILAHDINNDTPSPVLWANATNAPYTFKSKQEAELYFNSYFSNIASISGYTVSVIGPKGGEYVICSDYHKEEKRLRHLIESNGEDVKLLKEEYYQLTGTRFYAKR